MPENNAQQTRPRYVKWATCPQGLCVQALSWCLGIQSDIDAIRGETSGDLLAPEHAMKALTLSIATQRSLRERRAIEL